MSAGAPGSAGQRHSMRFRASNRLRKRFEFRRVRDLGRRVHTKSFLCLLSVQPEGAPTRLGITVTRQVACAVGRNRIKRIVREVFRQNRSLFPDAADIVVVAKRDCSVQSYGEAREEMIAASPAMQTAAARMRSGSQARSPR